MIMTLLRVLSDPDAYVVQIINGEIYLQRMEAVDPARLYPKER